ncbi:MarR family winged helix-turn-helix transcriptional regulator [Kitasatospora purpeofusca]|uniref:MarR family winged helix-turn-helix transcriptional regulator n=1 Tax=Kitasatospora purpeofusca TaxID=67352 RepID=UPI00225A4F13|nr:MarR family transcriptional regulator [Kitasatospora purpeofusca]MCX4756518.1 MarR family transcriptional regulator [Kitasatospora purpeofusca]WSR35674.1 MarR family transcriptional regulator [Kitasatospora purpeofusca]WSR43981.1 MarR family transcriptional regulator [Kitasatospora purpeofusca]
MAELDSPEEAGLVAQWRDLLARHARTACLLDRELGEKHGLGMSEFEVLERLVEGCDSGDKGLRVQELAPTVHLSQSALSRLIGRLEKAGLVTRAMCAADRRGIQVALTEEGCRRYAEARELHREVLSLTLTEEP